jgi:hypothetical protein
MRRALAIRQGSLLGRGDVTPITGIGWCHSREIRAAAIRERIAIAAAAEAPSDQPSAITINRCEAAPAMKRATPVPVAARVKRTGYLGGFHGVPPFAVRPATGDFGLAPCSPPPSKSLISEGMQTTVRLPSLMTSTRPSAISW